MATQKTINVYGIPEGWMPPEDREETTYIEYGGVPVELEEELCAMIEEKIAEYKRNKKKP